MKRIYACIAIVAALLGLSYYSSFQVRRFADEMGSGLDSAIQAVYQADYPTAQQVILSGADRCDEMREGMNHLLRTQTLRNWKLPCGRPKVFWHWMLRKKPWASCAVHKFR